MDLQTLRWLQNLSKNYDLLQPIAWLAAEEKRRPRALKDWRRSAYWRWRHEKRTVQRCSPRSKVQQIIQAFSEITNISRSSWEESQGAEERECALKLSSALKLFPMCLSLTPWFYLIAKTYRIVIKYILKPGRQKSSFPYSECSCSLN